MIHGWRYCDLCDMNAVICRTCGNNCCNGGYGELPNGDVCPDCPSAYDLQDTGWADDQARNERLRGKETA